MCYGLIQKYTVETKIFYMETSLAADGRGSVAHQFKWVHDPLPVKGVRDPYFF